MHLKYLTVLCICMSLASFLPLEGITISEKKAGLIEGGDDFDPETQKLLEKVNLKLKERSKELQGLYRQAQSLYSHGGSAETFKNLLGKINLVKKDIQQIEENWRETIIKQQKGDRYALWHQPATTVEQLVIDYGSQEYVYLIPKDIAEKTLSVSSSIAIPRAMWTSMLELILNQQGIGFRQLNPYLRQLYLTEEDHSGIKLVTANRSDLEIFSREDRVGFVFTPEPTMLKRVAYFLEKFINPKTTTLQVIGRDIFIASTAQELQELLKLYDFAAVNRGDREYKLVTLNKVDTEEITKILEALFEQFEKAEEVPSEDGTKSVLKKSRDEYAGGLRVIPLSQVARAVFLVGTKDEIAKAEGIIREIEGQVAQVRGKVLFSYKVKHSDPEELAQVLDNIYYLLLTERESREMLDDAEGGVAQLSESTQSVNIVAPRRERRDLFSTGLDDTEGYYLGGSSAIGTNTRPIQPPRPERKEFNQGRSNFMIEPKTGIMVMVIEPDILPRLRDLIRRIDVPKKMVQLDVLLFEKSIRSTEEIGLQLLKVGGKASNTRLTSICWNDTAASTSNVGVLDFFLSRMRGNGIPAYDIAFRFLMTLADVTINANPSVVTLNQTPAYIAVAEELSINTGIVEISSAGGPQSKDSFTRAQYGTFITITPTIHMRNEEDFLSWDPDEPDYVTLDTDVIFDTVSPSSTNPQQPDVIRRNIKNYVRIPDGKTVILGGLRRKQTADTRAAIPYLGEIPCLGKAFSDNTMTDNSTEMFIFITPTIISDPCEDFEKVKMEQLTRRPGDIPAFLCALNDARCREKHRCFAQGCKMLFGRRPERCIPWGDDSCQKPRIPRDKTPYGVTSKEGMLY